MRSKCKPKKHRTNIDRKCRWCPSMEIVKLDKIAMYVCRRMNSEVQRDARCEYTEVRYGKDG
jgi:hypothetical protein